MSFLFLLIEELSVIDHLADRRFRIRCDLHQIQAEFACPLNGIACVHYADRLAIFAHNAYGRNAYALVRSVKRFAKTRTISISTKSSCDISLLLLIAYAALESFFSEISFLKSSSVIAPMSPSFRSRTATTPSS